MKGLICYFFVLLLIAVVSSEILNENNILNSTRKSYFPSSDSANFFKAYITCKNAGMELANIASQDEAEDLEFSLRNEEKSGYWLSGTNMPDRCSKQFYWLTNGKPVLYVNWLPGEPNHYTENENCILWDQKDSVTGWNDADCNLSYKFICQEKDKKGLQEEVLPIP